MIARLAQICREITQIALDREHRPLGGPADGNSFASV